MNYLKKILNIYVLQTIELLLAITIIILSFYNIRVVDNPEGTKVTTKLVFFENIKYLPISIMALILAFYLLEWVNKPAWLRIIFFVIFVIVCLAMLLEQDKNKALENINIATFISAIFYSIFLIVLIVVEMLKKFQKKLV